MLPMLLLPLGAMAQGQQGSGSPYSAYGFGELIGSTPVAQAVMGGLGAATVDPVSTVPANPASYPFLHRTTFEMGVQVRTSTFATGQDERLGRRTDILGITLGIPFGKGRWGMAIGARPVSRVNYRITDTEALPGGVGDATFTYTGDGGLNQGLLGAGCVLSQRRDSLANGHRFSFGVNLGYLFGRIESSSTATFPTGQGFYATRVSSTMVVRDPTLDAGLQFQGDLRERRSREDKGLYYLLGVSAELPVDVTARRTDVSYTYGFSGSGVEVPLDTSYFVTGGSGLISLPLGLRAGATVFNDHWTVGVEYGQRDWSSLRVDADRYDAPGELAASTTFIAAASYRPAKEVGGSIWERTVYRAGLRFSNDYLVVGGSQLKEKVLTAGISLPVMGTSTRSRLNIGGEFGERGTLAAGLVRERYATLLMGITITPDIRESWFKKRRID